VILKRILLLTKIFLILRRKQLFRCMAAHGFFFGLLLASKTSSLPFLFLRSFLGMRRLRTFYKEKGITNALFGNYECILIVHTLLSSDGNSSSFCEAGSKDDGVASGLLSDMTIDGKAEEED